MRGPGGVALAFRLCLSRHPAPDEKRRLHDLLSREPVTLEKPRQEAEEAAALARRKSDRENDVQQLAAWTTVSRVLLNLDETITRE